MYLLELSGILHRYKENRSLYRYDTVVFVNYNVREVSI